MGNSCFYWCWHVICQVMRFQKLKAQMSAHCESSHLCAGGEEAESLVMPWLEDSAVLCPGRPLMADPRGMEAPGRSMLQERQAVAAT